MRSRRGFMALGASVTGASALSTLMWPGLAGAQTLGKRYALVIGNDAYPQNVGKLRNAGNDARLVAKTLQQCGFEVPEGALVINGAKADIEDAARAHAKRLADAGEKALGFVYYAGHGAARPGGDNYLIPIIGANVDVGTDTLWDRSIALNWLFGDAFAGVAAPQIVSIDACRNELRTGDRTIGGNGSYAVRSLQVVAGGEGANMYLSFATWQGQTASDGGPDDGHGPYALALAKAMVNPGLVLMVFENVRQDVEERTARRQEVMNCSRLKGEASKIQIGGGIDPATLPTVSSTPQQVADAIKRSIAGFANLALVISCRYTGPRALPKAHADADKVADALKASGFEVVRVRDPDREAIERYVSEFADRLRAKGGRSAGVVHFSGHSLGVKLANGSGNWLFGAGPAPATVGQASQSALSLYQIVDKIQRARSAASVIFLDACRDLGVAGSVGKMTATSTVAEFGERNVLVAFPTSPGGFAADGPDGSYFADALAKEIRNPDRRDLQRMMGAVAASMRLAGASGRPSFVASTQAPIYFRDGTGLV